MGLCLILEILKRLFLAIVFLIAAIYASAAFCGAVIAIGEAVIYTKCLLSAGFDFRHADIIFDILTRDFHKSHKLFIVAALFIGLPTGFWGGWHTITKGVNPFKYMWGRD